MRRISRSIAVHKCPDYLNLRDKLQAVGLALLNIKTWCCGEKDESSYGFTLLRLAIAFSEGFGQGWKRGVSLRTSQNKANEQASSCINIGMSTLRCS